MTLGPHALLRQRYAPPAYAYFEEVGNGTGGRVNTYADGIAMSLWPSRGIELLGFEVKISRNDLLRELKNPEKNVGLQKYCHRWWLVLSDKDLIKAGELPPTWGLMAVVAGHLRAIKEAPLLAPEPWTPIFFAGLMRGVQKAVDKAYVAKTVHDALNENIDAEVTKRVAVEVERQLKNHHATLEQKLHWAELKTKNLRETIDAFEKASGVQIIDNRWMAAQQGAAFRIAEQLLENGRGHDALDFGKIAAAAQRLADGARVLADVRDLAPAAGKIPPIDTMDNPAAGAATEPVSTEV